MRKKIPMDGISIPEQFRTHPPRTDKIDAKITGFNEKRRFEPLPIVDQDMNLIDGYASYMAAKRLGHAALYCEIQENPMTTVITARHQADGKDYKWALPRRASNPGYIKIGTAVAVPTKFGTRKAVVTAIEKMPAIEAKALKTALGRWHEKTVEELAAEGAAEGA